MLLLYPARSVLSNRQAVNLPTRNNLLSVDERVRVFGVATCYRLDGSAIEARWACNFPHPFTPTLGSI